MPRASYVWRDGKLVDKRLAAPLVTRLARTPGICAPGLIRDSMDPTVHPCTGKVMDSKAAFRAVTREHGCIELGNESPEIKADPGAERAYRDELKSDIHAAMETTEHRPAETFESVLGEGAAPVPAVDGWA